MDETAGRVPDFDLPALVPGASVFMVLAWLIWKLQSASSADRVDYTKRIAEHHASHRVEVAEMNARWEQRLRDCEQHLTELRTELKFVRQEVEAARAARFKAEEAYWRLKAEGDVEPAD